MVLTVLMPVTTERHSDACGDLPRESTTTHAEHSRSPGIERGTSTNSVERGTSTNSVERGTSTNSDVTAESDEYDVVIVGAGLSGLSAAKLIANKEPNLRVLILEKNGRVGGRVHPVRLDVGDGTTEHYDVGGQTFTAAHTRLRGLLAELGVAEYAATRRDGDRISHFEESGIVRHSASNVPSFGYELNRFMDLIGNLGQSTGSLLHLDKITLSTYIKQQSLSAAAHSAIETMLHSILGVDSSQISTLYFVVFASSTSGLRSMLNCSQKQVQGSTRSLLDALIDRMYFHTKTKEEVSSIEWRKEQVDVVTRAGGTYRARQVIVALPPHQVRQIRFSPDLSDDRKTQLSLFVDGHMTKFVVAYKQSFWTKMGLCGTAFCGLDGPIGMLHDSVSHCGRPALAAVTGGSASLHNASLSQDKRRELQLGQLSEWFGPKSRDYVAFTERVWPHGGGAFGPGAMALGGVDNLRKPTDRLHWAGTETSARWPGFMEGAVSAGQRTAMEVLHVLRPQMIVVEDVRAPDKADSATRQDKDVRKWQSLKVIAAWGAIGLIAFFIWNRTKS